MVDLTTDATLNGDSITFTVEDDLGNTDTVSIADGTSTVSLSTIDPSASQVRAQDIEWTGTAQLHEFTITPEPTPPQNLSATAANADQIDLSWDPPSDWGGDQGGYRIYRGQSSGSYSQIDSVGSGTTTYSDTGLEAGERYYYVVTAYNSAGESDNSNESDATTPVPVATIDSLDDSVENEITVNWTKNDDSSDGTWEIYRSTDGTLGSQVYSSSTLSTTSHTDTGLTDGQQYYYTVRRSTDHTSADVQASQTTLLPVPTIDSLDNSTEDEVTVAWTLNDDASDGDVHVYRSTSSGTLGSDVSGSLSLSTTSFTDTGLADGERYYYTIRRETTDATSDSAQQAATTVLPAPTNLASPSHGSTSVDLTWTANHDNGDTEVQYKPTSAGSWSTFSTVANTTEAETVTGLLNGERYDFRVRATTSHATAASGTIQVTTDLPDVGQPTLGNGVEDEIAVDWADVINNGSYRVQIRETGQSTWSSSATGYDEQVLSETTTSTDFAGLEDGEEYEVRIRTESEHETGAWTTPASIVTKFPGATGLSLSVDGSTQISGSFTDNSDNEDGFRVQRRDELDPSRPTGFGSWSTVQTLGSGETSFVDGSVDPNHDYEYRIEAFTEDAAAVSSTESATTDVQYADGWTLELRRSDGEKLTIDGEHFVPPTPRFSRAPSRITPWSLEIPESRVLTEEDWIPADALLWFDNGNELVLRGEVHKATHPSTAAPQGSGSATTRLEGADVGFEFKSGGAHEEYQNIEAYKAIEDYLTTYFPGWTVTVYEPTVQYIDQDKLVQSADSQSEWDSITSISATEPAQTTGGGKLVDLQTCWTMEGEAGNFNRIDNDASYSDGTAEVLYRLGDQASWTFTLDYDMPAEDFEWWFRGKSVEGNLASKVEWRVDGTPVYTVQFQYPSIQWIGVDTSSLSGDLQAGQHTLEAEVVEENNHGLIVDVVAPLDSRYNYTFDNSVDANGYLSGPEHYPDAHDVAFSTVDESRNVPSAEISVSMNDTGGSQALLISNDGGSTYPVSGSNTSTHSGTFPNPGSNPRGKIRLSRHGSRTDATPTSGYLPQEVDSYKLRVDTNSLAVIDSRNYTGSHFQNLQALCDDAGMDWVTPYDENGLEIEVLKPGEVSGTLPDVEVIDGDDITDLEQYYNAVTVFGGDPDGDGTPLQATAESQTEIDQYGRREAPAAFEPRLTSEADVENQANQLLAEYIAERDQKATRTIVPKSITPGYAYSVPGLNEDLVLREVQFEDGRRGQLRFYDVNDVVSVLTRQQREVKQTKDAF